MKAFPIALALVVFACIQGCTAIKDEGVSLPARAANPEAACQSLAGMTIDQAAIGLPTAGARVTSAVLVKALDVGNAAGEYCRILGEIQSVDPKAQGIGFRVNLPTHWNGKALQFGGGGYDGVLPNTVGPAPLGHYAKPGPLASGYMTLGSDSGHQHPDSNDASFGLNDEQLLNFAHMHIKKLRDVAFVLAKARYGSDIRRMYFAGGSSGGRAASMAAIKYPESFDGVLVNYPVSHFTAVRSWGASLRAAIYDGQSAGWIPPALVAKMATDTRAACDELDGAKDGLVSNMAACRAKSSAYLASITCKHGETGSPTHCLTPTQIERTIQLYHEGYTVPYAFANGVSAYRGYNILEGNPMAIGSQPQYQEPPTSWPNAHHVARADGFFKHIIARDPNFSMANYNVQNPDPHLKRLLEVSEMLDATHTDWRPFFLKGGKVLLVHGLDDVSLSPYQTADHYRAMVAKMGQKTVDKSMRFYLVPGLGHGIGDFLLSWDNLSVLDDWVDKGIAPPAVPIAYDNSNANRGRTRPLCPYPSWPQYKGSGSLNEAASFRCVN